MKQSAIIPCAILALALGLVEASNHYGRPAPGPYGNAAALAHYGGSGGCHGHKCNRAPARGPYGPYHSYAVRPVVYGGHGLYAYRGYARHPPAPAATRPHHRTSRSAHNKQHQKASAHHRPASAMLQHQIGGHNYILKPVKALVLGPAPSSHGRYQHYQQYNVRRAPAATAAYKHHRSHRMSSKHQNRYRINSVSGHQRYPQRHHADRYQQQRPASQGRGYGRIAGHSHPRKQSSGGY